MPVVPILTYCHVFPLNVIDIIAEMRPPVAHHEGCGVGNDPRRRVVFRPGIPQFLWPETLREVDAVERSTIKDRQTLPEKV